MGDLIAIITSCGDATYLTINLILFATYGLVFYDNYTIDFDPLTGIFGFFYTE